MSPDFHQVTPVGRKLRDEPSRLVTGSTDEHPCKCLASGSNESKDRPRRQRVHHNADHLVCRPVEAPDDGASVDEGSGNRRTRLQQGHSHPSYRELVGPHALAELQGHVEAGGDSQYISTADRQGQDAVAGVRQTLPGGRDQAAAPGSLARARNIDPHSLPRGRLEAVDIDGFLEPEAARERRVQGEWRRRHPLDRDPIRARPVPVCIMDLDVVPAVDGQSRQQVGIAFFPAHHPRILPASERFPGRRREPQVRAEADGVNGNGDDLSRLPLEAPDIASPVFS